MELGIEWLGKKLPGIHVIQKSPNHSKITIFLS